MSGGKYDYAYFRISELADNIERDFVNDGEFEVEDFLVEDEGFNEKPIRKSNRIADATEEEKNIILAEVKSLIKDLKNCALRAKEIEWYMSGDTGATTYLKRLKKLGLII